MKNTRRQFLLPFALAIFVGYPASALEACRPVDSYVGAVNKIIDTAVGGSTELALTVLPSFEAEYGVRMIGNDVYLVQLRPSFWESSVVVDGPGRYHHDFRRARVGVSIQKARLSSEVAKRVRQTYANAVSKVKGAKAGGIDGTTYRFVLRAVGCGETWSPQPGSSDGSLVDLAELLAAHARLASPLSMRRSEAKILHAVSTVQ